MGHDTGRCGPRQQCLANHWAKGETAHKPLRIANQGRSRLSSGPESRDRTRRNFGSQASGHLQATTSTKYIDEIVRHCEQRFLVPHASNQAHCLQSCCIHKLFAEHPVVTVTLLPSSTCVHPLFRTVNTPGVRPYSSTLIGWGL